MSCTALRRLTFTLRRRVGQRIVKAKIYVNGHLRLVRRGRNLRRVTLNRLPPGRLTVRIVSYQSGGTTITSVRRYRNCVKTVRRTRHKRTRHRRTSRH